MWPRILMLLLILIAPTSSWAATACCDEPAIDACCEPSGECPTSGDGECALADHADAFKSALPAVGLPLPVSTPPLVFAPSPVVVISSFAHAREPARTPRYLLLQSLRN